MGYLTYLLIFHISSSSLAGKIARHEIPDWCPNPAIPYPHCVGQATTLDVGCYPPPSGAGPGAPGPDLLPPKRQTVVDRLKRRLEVYRRHQGSCLPRYDQAANGLYDAQRQETLLLKQKFLETKAKKTRRNDHHGRNAAGGDQGQRNNVVNQSKLKRQASSPLLDCAIDNITDGHPSKIPRAGAPSDTFCNSTNPQTHQQQNPSSGIPSFSVQIVQQFSSNTSQSHSQTIQTNVTVQALSNNSIKTSNSPLASNAVSTTSSPGCAGAGTSANDSCNQLPNSAANSSGAMPSTSISVGTNVECKQEPDTNYAQCSVNGSHPLPELSSELTSANNNANTTTTSSTAATTGDRFSDSLANLGFPEDSNDDVIHPDILKDIIDDVFTNPSDLMNGFNFVDSIGLKDNNQNINDEKDSLKTMMSLSKSIQNSPPNNFQNSANSPSIFTMSQSQQSVFDFQTGVNSNNPSQSVPNNSNNVTQGYQSGRLGSYAASSPNLSGISNNGLGLDFKLTEPSPAAQTLKQMAEQHQNMQQKQQQLNLGIGANHPRSPFGSDSFPDPLSNMRTNFMNGSPTPVQKSPTGLFQPMGFSQQQSFTATSGSTVKQEVGTPNTPLYQSNMSQHLPDMELHKRRQVMQMQQSQMGTLTRPPFSHSPDQKRPYQGMRNLPHYNDPSPGHSLNEGSASNSPVPHHPGQFMRGVSTPGVTPPPQGFGSSPSPSAGSTLHMSQSQQIQMSASNQQIQMTQTQQHLIMNQDKKSNIIAQQQQQNLQSRGFYTGQNNLHMSQSQSMSFFNNGTNRGGNAMTNQRPNPGGHPNSAQRHISHQYMSKPPPDYQAPMEANNCNNHTVQSSSLCQSNQMQMNMSDSINNNGDQSGRNVDQRNSIPITLSQSYNMIAPSEATSSTYPGIIPLNHLYPDLFPPDSNNIPTSRPCPSVSSSSANSNVRRPYPGLIPISDLITRPCSGESPSSDNSSNEHRPYPGLIPISELIPRSCANESPSTNPNGRKPYPGLVPLTELMARQDETVPNTNSSIKRSYAGIPIPDLMSRNNSELLSSNKPISDSSDRSFPGVTSLSEINNTQRPYPGLMPIEEALSLNRGCSNSGAVTNANSSNVSKPYPSASFCHSTSVSGPYSSMSSISAMPGQIYSQASHMLTNPTVTSSATYKGRGKQVSSRSNKQCSSLQRQQKAPNVNVGPEGLNISQRPPPVVTDWRQTYVHHSQHQMNTNMNDDVIVTYSRNGTHEFGSVNNSNVNNFQSGHMNSNSPAGENHSLLSLTQSTSQAQMQSNTIQDLETGATNQLMMQSQGVTINGNNSFQTSQIQLSGVSTTDMSQSNIFSTSPSPNNSLQNIVPDGSQFNLDFLDNMDCSASDLLNFDVMQGESSNFPILDDIAMLDK